MDEIITINGCTTWTSVVSYTLLLSLRAFSSDQVKPDQTGRTQIIFTSKHLIKASHNKSCIVIQQQILCDFIYFQTILTGILDFQHLLPIWMQRQYKAEGLKPICFTNLYLYTFHGVNCSMKDRSSLKGTQSCHPLPRLMPYPVSFKQSNLDPHQN